MVFVAAATVYGPGLAVLLALGVRQWAVLLGITPGASVGVALLTSCACALLGVPFSPRSLVLGTVLLALLGGVLGWVLIGRRLALPRPRFARLRIKRLGTARLGGAGGPGTARLGTKRLATKRLGIKGLGIKGLGNQPVGTGTKRLGNETLGAKLLETGRPRQRTGTRPRRRTGTRLPGRWRPSRWYPDGWHPRRWLLARRRPGNRRWFAPPPELPAPTARPLLPELGPVSRVSAQLAGAALVLLGAALVLRTWFWGLGSWSTYNQDHDTILHSVLIGYIQRSGRGAPWQIMPADVLAPDRTVYYPDGFHLLAATIGTVFSDPIVGMNGAAAMVAGAAWTTSAAALGAVAVRWLRADAGWMAMGAGVASVIAAGLYRPGAQLARDNGLLPNACALVLVPGVVAAILVIRPKAWGTALGLGLACAGVVTVHPSAGLSVGLTVLVLWLALLCTRDGRTTLRAQWSVLVATVAVGALCAAPVLHGALAVSDRIEAFPPDARHLPIGRSLGTAVPLMYGGMFDDKGMVQVWPTLLLLIGVATALALSRALPLVVAWLAWVVIVLLAYRNPHGVTAPILAFFYNSAGRVQSHTALLAPALATLGAFGILIALMVAIRAIRLPGRRQSPARSPSPRAVGALGVLALLLLVVGYLVGPTGKYQVTTAEALAQRWSAPQLYRVDAEDIAAAEWLKPRVKPGQRIMNSPNDGSTYLYVHDNLPVVNISTLGVPGFPYTYDLMRGFRYLDVDPKIRRWVLQLNIAWVYVDSRAPIIGANGAPGNWTGGGLITTVPGLERLDDTPGLILAHVSGAVRIYQVDLDWLRRLDAADRGP